MRLLNNGNKSAHISLADGTDIHIYPGTEEDLPDELYYKVSNRIKADKNLEVIKASKKAVKPKIKVYTHQELYKMNKAAQVKLLNRYGIEKIPKLEINRIKAILKLQV